MTSSDKQLLDAEILAEALGSVSDGVAILQPENTIAWANAKLLTLFGTTMDRIRGQSLGAVGVPEPVQQQLLRHIAAGGSAMESFECHQAAAAPMQLQVELGRRSPGQPAVAIFYDRSKEREQDLALKRRAEEYRVQHDLYMVIQSARTVDDLLGVICTSMVEMAELEVQAKTGVFLVDQQTGELVLSKTHGDFCQEFLQAEARIPLGACLCGRVAVSGELLVSENCFDDPRHEHRFDNMTAHGHYIVPLKAAGRTLGVLFLYTDAQPKWDQHRIDLLRSIGGTVGLAIQRLRDEEALHRLADELRDARDEALRAVQAKTRFVANMSHELRTPLNAVIGMTDLLRSTRLEDEQMDYVNTTHAAGRALLGVINDILDFSKIEADGLELECVAFSPRTCVEEVGDIMRLRAAEKRIELVTSVHPSVPPRVVGDPIRLRQVLLNLVGNAVKFTHEGEVLLQVELAPARGGDGLELAFRVKDTGIGIPPKSQQRIFSAFSQQDSSITRRFGGTGLGLAITRELVQRMGGEIVVESAEGEGSTFGFTIAVDPAPDDTSHHILPCPNSAIRGMEVLVVDDNATNRRVVHEHLQQLGVRAQLAASAEEALELLDAEAGPPPALGLIDLTLPDISGLELASQIRGRDRFAQLPLVLMSTLPPTPFGDDSPSMGHLTKPIKRCTLCKTLALTQRAALRGEPIQPEPLAQIHQSELLRRVLVVEDNEVNQRVTGRMLQKLGYRYDVASHGQDAVAAADNISYDVILMDCQMPVMDGIEATRLIRAAETSKGGFPTPIIALSAASSVEERRRCTAAGMNHFLAKPMQMAELQQALSRFCAARTPATSSES